MSTTTTITMTTTASAVPTATSMDRNSSNTQQVQSGASATVGSPLKCCRQKSSDSLTSTSTNNEQNTLCETMSNFVGAGGGAGGGKKNGLEMSVKNGGGVGEKKRSTFPKRECVDLKFDTIKFSASALQLTKLKLEKKEILHGVSGLFRAGELSVIMGPSGAGKSTLLNVLAGYVTSGSSGKVSVNDEIRDGSPRFKKLVAYIPQEEEVRLSLTVFENMIMAADLKLGYSVSQDYKVQQVKELLEVLGLEGSLQTVTSRLSGGQRKRLAIALELLSNPPIVFLDEPTTGLDSMSCSQCIALLKRLASEGRTVICTIHQPSALLFEMFDHLYVLAHGKCIYDGTVKALVPHLASVGLQCPKFHNPADFLMEVAIGEYGTDLDMLADLMEEKKSENLTIPAKEKEVLSNLKSHSRSIEEIVQATTPRPANQLMQFVILYKRNLLMAKRQYMVMFNRFIAHVLIGLLFGYLYKDVGQGANTVLANYVYLYGSLLLIVYTGQMSVTISFPLEMKTLSREYFNRWYKLSPYLLSMLLIEIPFQVLCTWVYIFISYWLTDQPVDSRLYFFVAFCTLSTLCAQAWGYFIGATTPIKIAVFLGPVLACLFSVFGFCIRYFDTPYMFRWMYYLSYFRAGFHGLSYAVYGLPRPNLLCPSEDMYCHYVEPTKFLKEMDIVDINLWSNMTQIVAFSFIMHTATYFTLWRKLNKR